jgi:hypothetical protein
MVASAQGAASRARALFRGERLWGYDRMALLEERLADAGLRLADDQRAT